MTQQQPWSGFKYEPVRGLRDRLISRYLRSQRKNMRRFFTERGLLEFTDRMDRIRKSRQGMMAKNQMFQEVLNAYAARTAPQAPAEATSTNDNPRDHGIASPTAVAMQPTGQSVDGERGLGDDAGSGVQGLADADGTEPVIEE